MATKSFKINYYRAHVGFKGSATWSGVNIQIQGYIACYGDDRYRFIIYFLHEDSSVPPPVYNSSGKVGALFLPFKDMSTYIDMIRNEEPLYAYLNSDKPEWNSIRTSNEPVGEEET